MRLDLYLAEKYPEHSRSVWAKLVRRGYVRVNGQIVASVSLNVAETDKVTVEKTADRPCDLNLPVIYGDENVIVVDKPAGILTHSKGALNDEFTVADFIRKKSKYTGQTRISSEVADIKIYGSDPYIDNNRFGIVHRLDRATSGVIIGAKNDETLKFLQKQFSGRKVKKTYYAVVEKAPKDSEFRIDLPIGRNPKHPSQFRIDPKGKPAVTDVRVIKTYDDGRALLELKPQTGRTHQLRVHLAYIGSPIVGDPVYGAAGVTPARMMLHAAELEITLPGSKRKKFKAKIPWKI